MRNAKHMAVVASLAISAFSSTAFAWGEQGHHVICEAATRLVKDPTLVKFFKARNHQLGHLCNIADITWKDPPAATPASNAAHFLDPETFNMTVADIPVSYAEMAKRIGLTPEDASVKMGSLWWRGDQFYRAAVTALRTAKTSPAPTSQDAQNFSFPYNVAVYDFITNVGLLGHFVGDTTMPYHNTADYDGYGRGHGGIHGFYESDVVNSLDLDLAQKVLTEAKRIEAAATSSTDVQTVDAPVLSVIERLKQSSVESAADIPALIELDKVIEPSTVTTSATGQTTRVAAKRPVAATVAASFEPMIVHETARAALLLAQLMDDMQREAGIVDLAPYRSYRYPVAPPFVAPDYIKGE